MLPKDTYTIKTYYRVYQYSKGDTMKIERNTKVQQGRGVLTTSIPQTITEIMNIERGTPLIWTLTDEGKVTIQKEDTDEER